MAYSCDSPAENFILSMSLKNIDVDKIIYSHDMNQSTTDQIAFHAFHPYRI